MQSFYAVAGLVVLFAIIVDIVWTTIGTHGGGPITSRVTDVMWRAALALHRRRNNHRLLSFGGTIILSATVLFWIVMIWAGWTLLFSANPMSLTEDSNPSQGADVWSRIYFVGYSMFTLGNGDLRPNGPLWRVTTSIACGSGLGAVTLAITYLLEVLSAVVQTRTLGAYISDLGATPREILTRAWTGEKFDSLEQHLIQITAMVHLFTEQHLAYPVLHYFHSENQRTAAALRVVALHETVLLLTEGVSPEKRLPVQVTQPLRNSMHAYARVITGEFVEPEHDAPDPPPLAILRDIGVPTVDDETFAAAVKKQDNERRALFGLLHDDGWTWGEMMRATES